MSTAGSFAKSSHDECIPLKNWHALSRPASRFAVATPRGFPLADPPQAARANRPLPGLLLRSHGTRAARRAARLAQADLESREAQQDRATVGLRLPRPVRPAE